MAAYDKHQHDIIGGTATEGVKRIKQQKNLALGPGIFFIFSML
jgi:hypothetical protein